MKMLRMMALAAAAVIVLSVVAQAERPLRTDDPFLVGRYRYEKYGGVSIASGSWDNFKDRNEIGVTAGFDYGLTEFSEVGIEGELFRHIDPGKTGIGDAHIHFKHMFRQEFDAQPAQSFDFRLTIPTASKSRGLGDGKPEIGAHWLFGWRNDIWETSGRLGYVHTVESRLEKRYEMGAAARYRTDYNVRFLGELYGDSNEKPSSENRIIGSLGVAYEWTPSTVLDFLMSVGLSESVPDVGIDVGFRSKI